MTISHWLSAAGRQKPGKVLDLTKEKSSGFGIQVSWFIYILVSLVFCSAFSAPVFGAEEAAHGAEWKEWLWKIINFAILVFILVKFLGKPLKAFLRHRTELIEKTLKEAKEAKALAEQALAEVEDKLRLKDTELQDILAQSRQAAEKEQELLLQQSVQMKEKILNQAKNNIEYELKLAKDAIRTEAAGISMELAEKKLKEKLTGDEQTRLMEESIARIEGRN